MNYFELFQLPISLKPNQQLVKQQFYALSRQYHPDFFTQSNNEEQADVLEKSSQINKAFHVLRNEDATMQYVLQLKGLLEEEEKYQLPKDFLMEMIELNEQLADARIENDTSAIENIQIEINHIQQHLYEPVQAIVEHYQEGVTSEKELLQVKAYYYKKKYLNRILASIN